MARTQKTAIVSGVTFQADTVAEARRIGETRIASYVRECLEGPSIVRAAGMTGIVMPNLEGWSYSILEWRGGERYSDVCSMGGTRTDCILDCYAHIAQYVWTRDVPDDLAFLRDIFATPLSSRIDTRREAAERTVSRLIDQFAWSRAHPAPDRPEKIAA